MTKKNERNHEKKKIQELENQLKRIAADYQNLEKRTQEERREWIKGANRDILLRLLPVLDTLFLANAHLEDEGLRLSIQKFLGVLAQEGVKQIPYTVGSKFDPNLMEAVETREGEEGRVLKEIRTGFFMNGKVLRPTQVVVGRSNIDKKMEEVVKQEEQRGDYM